MAWEFKCILILSTLSLKCNPLFTSRYALLCSMFGLWDLYRRPCLHVTCVNMYVHVKIMFVDLLWSKYLLFLDEELLVRLKSKKSIKFLVLCLTFALYTIFTQLTVHLWVCSTMSGEIETSFISFNQWHFAKLTHKKKTCACFFNVLQDSVLVS